MMYYFDKILSVLYLGKIFVFAVCPETAKFGLFCEMMKSISYPQSSKELSKSIFGYCYSNLSIVFLS